MDWQLHAWRLGATSPGLFGPQLYLYILLEAPRFVSSGKSPLLSVSTSPTVALFDGVSWLFSPLPY